MQYLILNYVPAPKPGEGPPARGPDMAAWSAYTQALIDAGVMRSGAALGPVSAAVTVRMQDGRRQVQDGPYADSREQLGGYYVIEVDDLDAALVWASRNPAAEYGAVEVRPLASP